MKINTRNPLLVASFLNFRRWLLLPLVIATCLAGCGGPREHAVALTADLGKAEASLQRNAVTLMRLREGLREGKPDTDYKVIIKALAKEYDSIKPELAKVEKNAEDLNKVVAEAQRQLSQPTSTTAVGSATPVGDPAQRAAALNKALTDLIRSRSAVNTMSGIYLPDVYNLIRDLASSREIWKSQVASAVDRGDYLMGNIEDMKIQLTLIGELLAGP